ncbi:hypothetical protein GA0115255_125411 [Streptomyces sp. Ncost-T6T-2b]|nr:hypothetical protein GA0115255_125411 [Streptomyces sp. Ncost-T6T-2b]
MRRWLPLGLAAAAAAALSVLVVPGSPASADDAPLSASADGLPPVAVEDFAYPNAAEIFAETGLQLISGDGNITLAGCGPTGLVEVHARGREKFCFAVRGTVGRLALEVPGVYGIKGADREMTADMTVDGTETSYEIAPNNWTAVGESADPEGRDHTLVELRVTK